MSYTVVGKWVIYRRAANLQARQDAELAAEEIIAESRLHSLVGISIRELLEDGRRA